MLCQHAERSPLDQGSVPGLPRTRQPLQHIGQGETWFEIIDELPSCDYNYNEQLSVGADCSVDNKRPQMPRPICLSEVNQDKHYELAQKKFTCTEACENVTDSKGYKYECDAYQTSQISTVEAIRVGSNRIGKLCTQFPGEEQSYAGGGGINPSIQFTGSAVLCYERIVFDGTDICDERPKSSQGNAARQRLCICSRRKF